MLNLRMRVSHPPAALCPPSPRDAVEIRTPAPPGWGRPAERGLEMGVAGDEERRKAGEETPGSQGPRRPWERCGGGEPQSPGQGSKEGGSPAVRAGALTRTM